MNDRLVTRSYMNDGDEIRVCSAHFRFDAVINRRPPREAVTVVGTSEAKAHIVTRVDVNRSMFPKAEETSKQELLALSNRLKTIYAVSEAITSILDIDELLPEILNRIFEVFSQCERAFIMLVDESGDRLVPKAVKRRQETDSEELTVSKTILHEVMTKRHAVISHDAMEDSRFKSGRSVANFGIRAMMAAPLVWRGETLGTLYLDSRGIAAFSQAELELLIGISAQASSALGNARMHEELLKRQRLEQDLALAERIQQSFLPRRIPRIEGYTFAARYDPAHEVGGDFYDFIKLPEGRLGIVVGDVSGKGVGAALYMARLTRDLRYFALAESDPATVLSWMNRAVNESGQDDIFVTLIYVVLDAKTNTLNIGNAAHMPPAIRRNGEGELVVLDEVAGLPLGVLEDAEYETEVFELKPGDTVMLYTDGLAEAMSPEREMFGAQRTYEALKAGPSSAASLLERVVLACQTHVGEAAQFDDTTIVCVGLSGDEDTEQTTNIPPEESSAGHRVDDDRREAMRRIRDLTLKP